MPISDPILLLGNGLAENLVVPKLKTEDNPLLHNMTDVESEQPHIFPGCAVTRVQTKHESTKRDNPPTVSSPVFSPDLIRK